MIASFVPAESSCPQQVLALRKTIAQKIQALRNKGVELDTDRCVATDPSGESTDLDSLPGALAEATERIVMKKLAFSFRGDMGEYGFQRANLVALCSLTKTMDYWDAHPDEIPPPEHIEDSLYFDLQAGRPRESFVIASFVRALSSLERMKHEDFR